LPRDPQAGEGDVPMGGLLKISKLIDRFNQAIGHFIMWLVLGAVLISAGNAIMRKAFDLGSNAWLEIQWYLFSAVFMLGAGYVWLKNGHVRIDFISSKLSKRTNTIIDILGMLVFTVPLSIILVWLSWPVFERAWVSGEMSQNAGGLIRWPVLLLIPVGFAILTAQCLSELIKRFAYLQGVLPEPFTVEHEKTDEEILLEELRAKAEADDAARAAALKQGAAQ
jgi:TRAP-type mannitol/chloroaromatic compound transport system permease small subunit